jgi:crotonobetainyl-CoA:carnitine CoA-transferase CaiB-like acyl-CoA transferase
VEDARFASAEGLAENAAVAREIIAGVLAEGTLAEWTERFQTLRGQWAPVQDTLEVAADPQVRANGYLQETQTREGTRFELVASPVQFDEQPTPTRRAPEFNEHGDAILQELGYDWERILELKAAGAVA